ncbi:pyridine nucleotide-disulfide oxidoreductase [Actinoplanes sp. OR16]|nr:pyridine nucleotide-disulfide oxidoreductase [Actinoplanes sp. OR16]
MVGASAAGLAAAETLRREGFTGTVTLIGEEPSSPYDRPPLSKQVLSARWDLDRILLRSDAHLKALDLDIRLGVRADSLDADGRTVGLADGGTVPFDGLIVATGVRPRPLPGSGARYLRTIEDALALRESLRPGTRVTIVGAGFLGAECAAAAVALGCSVELLEPAPVPLAHAVGPLLGEHLSEIHRSHGVVLRTGVAVADVSAIDADVVWVAIGSQPNVEWLAASGLTVDDGLVCDSYCAAAPGIYAAGDVARWHNPLFGVDMRIEHRTNAAEQGMAAARNLLGAGRPFAPVPYFWSDQYDLKLHAFGYLRGHDTVSIVEGSLASNRFLATYRKEGRLVGVVAAGMPPKVVRSWRQAVLSGDSR